MMEYIKDVKTIVNIVTDLEMTTLIIVLNVDQNFYSLMKVINRQIAIQNVNFFII